MSQIMFDFSLIMMMSCVRYDEEEDDVNDGYKLWILIFSRVNHPD